MALALLLLCGSVRASHEKNPSKDWKALREKNLQLGFSSGRVDQTLAGCRKCGLSLQETEALLCPVYAAHDESLPAECILIKIEEGLAKQVNPTNVEVAAEARLDCLRRANRILSGVREHPGGEHAHLLSHMCMAMESGLPESVLQDVISRPGGFRYGRMIHVVEASETLQLAGLAPEQIQHLMNDFLDRDLNRMEIMRAVDFILEELAKGRGYPAIHSELWVRSDD